MKTKNVRAAVAAIALVARERRMPSPSSPRSATRDGFGSASFTAAASTIRRSAPATATAPTSGATATCRSCSTMRFRLDRRREPRALQRRLRTRRARPPVPERHVGRHAHGRRRRRSPLQLPFKDTFDLAPFSMLLTGHDRFEIRLAAGDDDRRRARLRRAHGDERPSSPPFPSRRRTCCSRFGLLSIVGVARRAQSRAASHVGGADVGRPKRP
jgi:hypothetical protein